MRDPNLASHCDHRRYKRKKPPLWPFFFLGILAQGVFALFFLMPGMNPANRMEEIEQARKDEKKEEKEKHEEVKQEIQDELQKLKQMKDEEDKSKLAEELFRELFDELVDEDLPPEEKEALWEEVKVDLNKELEDAIVKIDDFNRKRKEEELRKSKEGQKEAAQDGAHDTQDNAEGNNAADQAGTRNPNEAQPAGKNGEQNAAPNRAQNANQDPNAQTGAANQNGAEQNAANPNGANAANQNGAEQNGAKNGAQNEAQNGAKNGEQNGAEAGQQANAAGSQGAEGQQGAAGQKPPAGPQGGQPPLPGEHKQGETGAKPGEEALTQAEIDGLREKMIANLARIAEEKANNGFTEAAMGVLDKTLANEIGQQMGKKIKDEVGKRLAQKTKQELDGAKHTEDNNNRQNAQAEARFKLTKAQIEAANAKNPKNARPVPEAPTPKEEGTQGDALEAEDKLVQGDLKSKLSAAFDKQFKETTAPALAEKIADAIASDAQYSGFDKDKLKESLKPRIEKLLTDKAGAEAKAGENATAEAADLLNKARPQVIKPDQKTDPASKVGETAEKNLADFAKSLEEAMKNAANINLDLTEEKKGIHDGEHGPHGKFAALANKLAGLNNQLQAGRRDILAGRSAKVGDLADTRYTMGLGAGHRSYLWDMAMLERLKNEMANRKNKSGSDITIEETQGAVYAKTAEYKEAISTLHGFPEVLVTTTQGSPLIQKTLPTQVKAPFQSHIFSAIPFLPSKLSLDGDLGDWKDVPWQNLTTSEAPGVKQKAKFAYDKRGLWVCCDVIDANHGQTRNFTQDEFWLNDCIEIFVDMLNTKFDKRGTKDTQQFFFYPFGLGSDATICGGEAVKASIGGNFTMTKFHSDANDPDTTTIPMRKSKANEHGYQMEIFIPKAAFRSGEFNPGRYIGFNMSICNEDKYWYWVPGTEKVHTSEHPDTWGDLNFVGTNASLEFVEESGKKENGHPEYRAARYVVPGQVLMVRVLDRDMDLDPRARNKVEVTIYAGPGNRETVLCEETNNDSGEFIGRLIVRPATGENVPNQLELIEGEGVMVEYRDQAREDGHHNYRLTGSLPGAPVGFANPLASK